MENSSLLIKTIQEVINEYLHELEQPSNNHVVFVPVIDKECLHFQIVAHSWENNRRVFNLLFHLDIIEGKIWIQEDKMEYSIAEKLVEKGIPKKQIVLAYFPDYHRKYTEYAVQ